MTTIIQDCCPHCKVRLPEVTNFRVWCPACDWNIEDDQSNYVVAKPTLLQKALRRFGDTGARRQFDELIGLDQIALRSPTRSLLVAYALAIVVYGVFAALLFIGLYLTFFRPFPAIIAGIFLLTLGMAALPRIDRLDMNKAVSADDAPALHGLIREVARAMGAAPPRYVFIDGAFNASFGPVGLSRASVLTIGLPLWSMLAPAERVALIAHELAHSINKDPLRGFLLSNAVHALFRWADILIPNSFLPAGENLLVSVIGIPLRLLSIAFGLILQTIGMLLLSFIWKLSQRAEYFADILGAQTAGTEGFLALIERLEYCRFANTVVLKIAYSIQDNLDFFEMFPAYLAAVPELERERLRRLSKRQHIRFDSTHPPNVFRMRMLEKHHSEPAMTLSESVSHAIDTELRKYRKRAQDHLIGTYFPYM